MEFILFTFGNFILFDLCLIIIEIGVIVFYEILRQGEYVVHWMTIYDDFLSLTSHIKLSNIHSRGSGLRLGLWIKGSHKLWRRWLEVYSNICLVNLVEALDEHLANGGGHIFTKPMEGCGWPL